MLRINPAYIKVDWMVTDYRERQRYNQTNTTGNTTGTTSKTGENRQDVTTQGTTGETVTTTGTVQEATGNATDVTTTGTDNKTATGKRSETTSKAGTSENKTEFNEATGVDTTGTETGTRTTERATGNATQESTTGSTTGKETDSGTVTGSAEKTTDTATQGTDDDNSEKHVYNRHYKETKTDAYDGYAEDQYTLNTLKTEDKTTDLKKQGTFQKNVDASKNAPMNINYNTAAAEATPSTPADGATPNGSGLPTLDWSTMSAQAQHSQTTIPIGTAADEHTVTHNPNTGNVTDITGGDHVRTTRDGSTTNTVLHEDGTGSTGTTDDNETVYRHRNERVTENDSTSQNTTGTKDTSGSTTGTRNETTAGTETGTDNNTVNRTGKQTGTKTGADTVTGNTTEAGTVQGDSEQTETGTTSGNTQTTASGTREQTTGGTSEKTGTANGTTSTTANVTETGTATGETNGTAEGLEQEVYTGRGGAPAELLARAMGYIRDTNAFYWLADKLAPCFMGIA